MDNVKENDLSAYLKRDGGWRELGGEINRSLNTITLEVENTGVYAVFEAEEETLGHQNVWTFFFVFSVFAAVLVVILMAGGKAKFR